MATITNIPPCTIIMEACGGSHYWARRFAALNHNVKLISPQFVKPFVKGNKTDRNDAQAIAEAGSRPQMRFVGIKFIEQQDIQSIHRIRQRLISQRTALCNQIRGLLAEYGIVVNKSVCSLRKALPQIIGAGDNELSPTMNKHIHYLYEELCELNERVKRYDQEINILYKGSTIAQNLGKIEGVGPVIATAMLSLGDLKAFQNGRHFAAFLGLVPHEFSSGDHQRLGHMSKRGNRYIRTLLIHGARAVLAQVKNKNDRKSLWLKALIERRGYNRACCALANKTARIIWAIISQDKVYQADYDISHVDLIKT